MNTLHKYIGGIILVLLIITNVALVSVSNKLDSVQKVTPAFGATTDNRFTQIPSNTSFTCGPTSNIVVATSSSRLYLALVNDGTSTVYLGLGSTATTSKGIRLNASGGSLEMDTTSLFTGAVYCVSAASSTLTVTESTQ